MTAWLPKDDPLWYWAPARAISVLVASVNMLLAAVVGEPSAIITTFCYLVLPLACVWFPEPIGDFTGSSGRGYIDRASPEGAIFVAGWVLLFLPIGVGLLMAWIER